MTRIHFQVLKLARLLVRLLTATHRVDPRFIVAHILEFLKQNYFHLILLSGILIALFIHYIFYSLPHCCEDINYLAYHSIEQRKNQFWSRTVSEGRWFFALNTAIISGHVVTYLFALIAVLSSAFSAVLIIRLLGTSRQYSWSCALLFAANPFFLVLYPWPISFAFFNVANLTVVACYYFYLRQRILLLATPCIVAICLATYQPTLSFLLQIVFLHFLSQLFANDRNTPAQPLKLYAHFLIAAAIGFLLYTLINKILLFTYGLEGNLRRYELWNHHKPEEFFDYFRHTLRGFKWFFHKGIDEGINPATSALVGKLSLRGPFVSIYKISLAFFLVLLFLTSVVQRSVVRCGAVLAAAPITILITLLPLIASGSEIINRVFYPFGLLLPTLIFVQLNQVHKSYAKWLLMAPLSALVVLHVGLSAQFSTRISDQALLAKRTHSDMLMRLYSLWDYSMEKEVVLFAHEPMENKGIGSIQGHIVGNYWPLYNDTPGFNQLINHYQEYPVNIVSLADLSGEEIQKVESHIRDNGIHPWPHSDSVFRLSSVRQGIFVVYLQLPILQP